MLPSDCAIVNALDLPIEQRRVHSGKDKYCTEVGTFDSSHCFQYCIMPREDTSSPATPLSWNTKAGPIIRFPMALIAKASVLDSQLDLDFDRNT